MPEATDSVENTCSVSLARQWINEEKQTLSEQSSTFMVIPEMNMITESDKLTASYTNGVCNFGFVEVG